MTMMRLDREGNAPVPDGYILVTTEVDFLKRATSGEPIHVRGERLCAWAEAFFEAREIQYIESRSYIQELRSVLPEASSHEIANLIELLGTKLETLDRPLSVDTLLNAAAPLTLWHEPPSLHHLAQWLIWLSKEEQCETLLPLFRSNVTRWQMEELPFTAELYAVQTKDAAQMTLRSWIGLSDRAHFTIYQEFPLEVPPMFKQAARQVWREEIIGTRGEKFEELVKQKIPFSLKKIAAEEAYQYYIHNQNDLTAERLESLIPYLSAKQISTLRNVIPPTPPSTMPTSPNEVITWYLREYLPYREWQRTSNSDECQKEILQSAREFELWYLDQYPRGINGGSLHRWLSFNRIIQTQCPDNCLTLVIILDGMHVSDSRTLLQNILSQTQRLSVTSMEHVFAPIPTVTRFAKEALLKGVPPNRAQDLEPVGRVLPERHSPAIRLQMAETGKIYIWRVLEPDDTYHHKNTSENLLHDVEGRLEAEAMKIKEIVESIPDSIILQIILTTDHGRLLSETRKTLPVPTNMESHGRAAWGKSPYPLNNGDYQIENDVAYLLGDSFGMLFDVAIPLDEGAFKDNNNRAGTELFPHGGIFPEEVILPWIVLARDMVQPEVTINIRGNGRARREGTFHVMIINKSDVEVTLEGFTITLRTGAMIVLDAEQRISARSQAKIELPYNPWPSAGELETVQATSRIRLSNKMVYEYEVDVSMDSEDIYIRPKDNILEDLE